MFFDENAVLFDDPDHSLFEERFLIIGISNKGNDLIVCHCVRDNENIIRIISARYATKYEERQYSELGRGKL